jgi:thiol-disulfide isomerase/thioredoxin
VKKIFVLLVFVCLHQICNAQYHYKIDGYLSNINFKQGVHNGDKIELKFVYLKTKDSAIVENDHFHFEGILTEPTVAMISYRGGDTKVLLDSSAYKFTLSGVEFVQNGKTYYTYSEKVETKSLFHTLWSDFYKEYGRLTAAKNKILKIIDKTADVDSILPLKKQIDSINLNICNNFKKTAIENSSNIAVTYFLNDAPDFSYETYFPLYQNLQPWIKNTLLGKRLLDNLNAIKDLRAKIQNNTNQAYVTVDTKKVLPETFFIDTSGKAVFLNAQLQLSNYTLIEFWASWCAPCRQQNVHLKSMYDDYKKKGVQVIGFSLDMDINNWKEAVRNDKMPFSQYTDLKADKSPLASFLKIQKIPFNVLVNDKGEIIALDSPLETLNKYFVK